MTVPSFASDFQSPRTAALGGAGRASPLLNDSIHLNPSFISLLPTYSVSINYLNPDPGVIYNVSVQDGKTELFQAGVSFTKRPEGKMIHVGASRALIKRLGFGIGGKFFYDNAFGETIRELNVSGTVLIAPWLQAGFIFDNLLGSDLAKSANFHREFAIGTKFNLNKVLLIYFDPHIIPDLPGNSIYGHEIGFELTFYKDVFLRAGQFLRSKLPTRMEYGRGNAVGLGWIGPKLSLDYALSRTKEPVRETTHLMGVTLYF